MARPFAADSSSKLLRLMTPKHIALILSLVLGGFASGCGDDDDGGSGSGAAPTKAEFIEQGDRICADADRAIEKEADSEFRGTDNPSRAALVKFAEERFVPHLEDESAQLRALPAPEDDGDTVTAIWDALDDGIASLKDDPAQILEEDPAAFADANRLARGYGFKDCGEE